MQTSVHIVISDTGWILEKMASELQNNLNYVSYGLEPYKSAPVQYYLTYGTWQGRISEVEIAYFTHRESVIGAKEKFDSVAKSIDVCVAQSKKTKRQIRNLGVKNSEIISPGVDQKFYSSNLQIGVVGRTYHTGRKGESLVAEVLDTPGIDFYFTGQGWPGEARFLEESELPSFYKSMDYILVPSLIEGGPMCALEAISCGTPVIASDVGWMSELPHISFKNGSPESLRKTLEALVRERAKFSNSVSNYTWDSFVTRHDQLFSKLIT